MPRLYGKVSHLLVAVLSWQKAVLEKLPESFCLWDGGHHRWDVIGQDAGSA